MLAADGSRYQDNTLSDKITETRQTSVKVE